MPENLQELIEAQDLNGLLRAVDGMCSARQWDDLVDLAERCEHAIERGKQVWPIAEHIDYRLALESPGEHAADVLQPGIGRFAPGPLTEVAASTHTWAELAPHIELPQVAAFVAQERVLRGENLTGDERAHAEILELPLVLQEWEPTYALATYRSDLVEVAEPWDPKARLEPVERGEGKPIGDPDLEDVLLELVRPWTAESNGAARVAVVEGNASAAISKLTPVPPRMGALAVDEFLAGLAWAAASGGAHGRRRGAALGRSLAWYTSAVLGGARLPVEPAELHERLGALQLYRWDEGEPEEGWILRIAVADPELGSAVALAATDLLEDEEI